MDDVLLHPAASKVLASSITIGDLAAISRALSRLHQIDDAPVLDLDQRREVAEAKMLCWSTIGIAVEGLIGLLDAVSGDPDIEPNGDELDASLGTEDDFQDHAGNGPGCSVADPGEEDDAGEDSDPPERGAWLERIDQTAPAYGFEMTADARNHEDAEDDDPGGANVEDEGERET